ncbi:fimbrial protein [Caballeronia sp. LZ032]|uniref:fimbrial protein n=1 Tax=Caballeronia sp. LZ032 TaxID=3038565 RepID=UPI00285DB1F1|nr:fimbrial protein [Caballeronia sp. LZ032]MDR5877346.1 fimbrial protein [Caballeronia sp. LZ032]
MFSVTETEKLFRLFLRLGHCRSGLTLHVRTILPRPRGSRSNTLTARKIVAAVISLSGMLTGAEYAHACAPTATFPDASVSFPATISVPANAPVGTVIATVSGPIPNTAGATYSDNCGNGGGSVFWALTAGPVQPNRIGATSVPGIGYTSSISGGGLSGTATMDTAIDGASLPNNSGANYFSSQVMVTVKLVVTGPVKGGVLTLNPTGPGSQNVVGYFYVGMAGRYAFRVLSPSGATSITARGCNVTTPAVGITLPSVSPSSLSNTGAVAGNTLFSLGLNCAAGTSVNLTLTDATTPSNTSNVLTLGSGSTASGVGLQILNGTTPIAYGPDSSAAGNTNQWSAGTASGGPMTIPLNVRYIRTANPMTPGKVAGLATFTMSYQ